MTGNKLNKDDKQAELIKYRELVLATLDYYIDNKELQFNSIIFNSTKHYKELTTQTEEHFRKGRLTKLKQWFRDLTEIQVETGNLKFNKYLKDKTKYDIDIFKSYLQRVDKTIEKGSIKTGTQFYDISIMVDRLCHIEPVDYNKIEILNRFLREYEQRKSRQSEKRKP